MKPRSVAVILAVSGLMVASGSVFAGGGGHGCIYQDNLVAAENLPLVPADVDSQAIDPKWLKLLEQQDESDAAALPVIHN